MRSHSTARKGTAIFMALCGLLLLNIISVKAQIFNAPTFPEQLYGPAPYDIQHTSAYNFNQTFMAAWDGPTWGGIVSIQDINPFSQVVNCQNLINYPVGTRDLEIGMLHGSLTSSGAPYTIVIAYHQAGAGHMVDYYDYFPGTCAPAFVGTMALSAWPNYSRISMDCHIEYACAITWQENDIRVKVLQGGTIAGPPPYSIIGSAGAIYPDVAFTHGGPLNVNVVYYDPFGSALNTEYEDFWVLHGGIGGFWAFTFDDNNPIPPNNFATPNIDGWDHGTDDWSYTWTHDQFNIYVRNKFGGLYTTSIVNDGSLGNFPLVGSMNDFPFLACSPVPGGGKMVVWWSTWAGQTIIGTHINDAGTAQLSTMDYYQVPNAPTASGYIAIPSLNKMTEFNPANKLYTIWPQDNSFNFNIKHRHHNWASPTAYKEDHTDCSADHTVRSEATLAAEETYTVSAFPNPFNEQLQLNLPVEWSNANVSIQIMDLSGRVVGSYEGTTIQANNAVNALAEKMDAGAYMLSISSDEFDYHNTIQIQKMK